MAPERTARPFRFGVIGERALPAPAWLDHVRRVEALGYDTFLLRDHLVPDVFGDQLAPLPALAAAALVTSRLRVGTLVLANDFRHPAVLAKEAATLDLLSGGRFELGIGAGWLRAEYEAAGIPFASNGERIDRLEETLTILSGLLSDAPLTFHGKHYTISGLHSYPLPAQRPRPPILVGGGKRRVLTLAGQHADIVGILTTSVASGAMVDDASERSPAAVEEKLSWVQAGAGARFAQIELSLIPTVIITDDRRGAAEAMVQRRGWPHVTAADVLEMPSVLLGTQDEIAEQILARRARYGFSYYIISDGDMEAFAPVAEQLAGERSANNANEREYRA
jgi:probable F420-dependent oxidoreductase